MILTKNLLAIFWGLFLSILLLIVFELSIYILYRKQVPSVMPHVCRLIDTQESCAGDGYLRHWRFLGYSIVGIFKNSPELKSFDVVQKTTPQRLKIWDLSKERSLSVSLPWHANEKRNYQFDHYQRRVTPQLSGIKDHFLVFFGGSWVFGDWLHDKETLPARLAARLPLAHSHNYGIRGGGLLEPFVGIHDPSFKNQIQEEKGIFIYVHTYSHQYRLWPTISSSYFATHKPFVSFLENGQLGYGGTLWEAWPARLPLFNFIYHSGIGTAFNVKDRVFPTYDTSQLECQMLLQTRQRLRSLYPSSRFLVVSYETSSLSIQAYDCLKNNDFTLIMPLKEGSITKTALPDGHPDAQLHQKVANYLAPRLNRILKEL